MRHFVAILLLFISMAAFAGIEKVAIPTDTGIKFMWWPKVTPPKGWHFDQGSSYHFGFNAIAPDSSTFSNAETVMYAKADYKPRLPATTTLQAFVNDDVASFKSEAPEVIIVHESALHIGQNHQCQLLSYHPATANPGKWEQVTYCEDGDYFLTFVVSSRTSTGLQAAVPAFRSMLSSYSVGP